MGLRRLRAEHLKILYVIFPLSAGMFGAYQQFLYDQESVSYRNKSKLFGGRTLPEGEVAWK
jgi:hypothetical protein